MDINSRKKNLKSLLKNLIKNNNSVNKIFSKTYYLFKRNKRKIKGVNNIVQHSEAFLSKVVFDINGDNNRIEIARGTRISNLRIYIRGNNYKLKIGKECIIKGRLFWFEDSNGSIIIGDKTTIQSSLIAVTEPNSEISIGKDCMISNDVEIRTGDSHSILRLEDRKRLNYAENVHINDHVWLGTDVVVLKGVTIENNSIVGIKSLVTKDIPANCVAAGIPARVIKSDVTWDRERI